MDWTYAIVSFFNVREHIEKCWIEKSHANYMRVTCKWQSRVLSVENDMTDMHALICSEDDLSRECRFKDDYIQKNMQ